MGVFGLLSFDENVEKKSLLYCAPPLWLPPFSTNICDRIFLKYFTCLVRSVKLGDRNRVSHVWKLTEVFGRLPFVEDSEQPIVLVGPEGEKVHDQGDAQWVARWVQIQNDFAELESCAVAGARAHVGHVTVECKVKGPKIGNYACRDSANI